ncbi:MAG: hypothetical protein GEU78_10255 [Actinobacteria bacterium]|nr:hypothetical protein [Actinomycetota bacterium]
MSDNGEAAIKSITALGFSLYEARSYVGLLGSGSLTAYALSKLINVPEPKLYDVMRRLVDRGAVVQVDRDPARYSAVPGARLLDKLDEEFVRRLDSAKESLKGIQAATLAEFPHVMWKFEGYHAVLERARGLMEAVPGQLYVTAWTNELHRLRQPLENAEKRGVNVVLLHFGANPVQLSRAITFEHLKDVPIPAKAAKTRHLGLVGATSALWALSSPTQPWTAIYAEDKMFASLVRTFIRHDIYFQQIHADFGPELRDVYGQNLERLIELFSFS